MRDLPRAVWALILARAVNRLGAFTLAFLGVILTVEVGAPVTTAGWLLALFGLATIPSRLVGGALADRVGRTTTICVGLVGVLRRSSGSLPATRSSRRRPLSSCSVCSSSSTNHPARRSSPT